jgi:hypothetical protein
MATNDLVLLARARRAYELGRLRSALRIAPFALAAAAVALTSGRPLALTAALTCVLLALATGFLYRGGIAGRAVGPGLLAGAAALAMPLLMATFGHACFGPACMKLGLPACIAGGVLAGFVIARAAAREQPDLRFVAAAAAIAASTGSLGCTIAGVAGVLGMLAGTVCAGVPVLIAARR